MMSRRDIVEKINQLKKETAIYESILTTPQSDKTGRPRGTGYPAEQLLFLKEHAVLTDKEIIIEFNKKFGTNLPLSSRQLYNLMAREGLGR